jgi:uncharacterized membrane protein YqiK
LSSTIGGKYVVAGDGNVVKDDGTPLPVEATALTCGDALQAVLQIAQSLGIRTQYGKRELRVYSPEEAHRGDRD